MPEITRSLGQRLAEVRILARSDPGTSFCSEGHSVRSATASMVLKVVTDNGRCVCDSLLRLRRLADQGVVDPASTLEQGAEG